MPVAIKAEAAMPVAINTVDANVTMWDPVQSWYGFVISQDGTLTVRFPGETKWYWKIVEITCLPVSVKKSRITDFVVSEEDDGYYFYTFQGKGKPVGTYKFAFLLTYQSGRSGNWLHRTAEFLLDVEVMANDKVDANVEIKDPVQSRYGNVISQNGTLTVRFPANAFGVGLNKIFEIYCFPVELQELGKKRIKNSVQAECEDFLQSRGEDGSYEYTFQGKGKEVGVYEFSFHLTYQSGVGATGSVPYRTAVILLDVEVMDEEDTKRQVKLLKAGEEVERVSKEFRV